MAGTTVIVPKVAGYVAYDPTAVAITGGTAQFNNGTAGAPPISFANGANDGLYSAGAGYIGITSAGVACYLIGPSNARYRSDYSIAWCSTANAAGTADTDLSRQAAGRVAVMGSTATPAGGSASLALVFGSTSGFGIYIGSGAPTVSAAQGSFYLRSDGSSTSTRAYINSSTGSGTTWTAITTAT